MNLMKQLQQMVRETSLLLGKRPIDEDDFIKINGNINSLFDTCHQLKDEELGKTQEFKELVKDLEFLVQEEAEYKLLLIAELERNKNK